jgi:hypothetical protein
MKNAESVIARPGRDKVRGFPREACDGAILMANFQKIPNDKSTRFDADERMLLLMLDENVSLDLWGGGPGGEDLVVDFRNPTIAEVSEAPVKRNGLLQTYAITGLSSGATTLEAKVLDQSAINYEARRQIWLSKPVYIAIDVRVMGAEYRQASQPWGDKTYGSTNPAWKNVHWTNMAEAGCGPTSLSIVIDYLVRLRSPKIQACLAGVDPRDTMAYTSKYGRAADNNDVPQGTSGQVMMANLSKSWPDLASEKIQTLADAVKWLRLGEPLVFLCKDCTTYKYDAQSNKVERKWGGHFMVVVGVEHDEKTFWISDPSLAHHKYISSAELKNTMTAGGIWRVYSTLPAPASF